MPLEDRDQLVSLISGIHLVTTFDVAACTLFLWDYILTFGMEVDLVWKSKWNFTKGLYFFQRYLPFVDTTGILLYFKIERDLTNTACRNLYYAVSVLMVSGLATSEMVLTLRTWAVWNRNQHLSIILPILYVLVWGSVFINLGIYVNSAAFGNPPYPGFKGCILAHANVGFVFIWVQVIIWDTLMLALMLVPGVRAYRYGGNSALVKAVYRDGVVYYLYLFVLSFLNIFLVKVLPLPYRHVLTSMERVFHSMLASRVLLHIRAQAGDNPGCPGGGLTQLSTIDFRRTEAE